MSSQCVAKNNTLSFYCFLLSILVYLISIEISTMMVFSNKNSSMKREMDVLGGILSILKHKNNLRSPSLSPVSFHYTIKS